MIATKTSVHLFLSLTYILLFDIFYVSLSIVSSFVDALSALLRFTASSLKVTNDAEDFYNWAI
jgi:hypothetical protein